jgi:mono/diheme cytochrome c family protein
MRAAIEATACAFVIMCVGACGGEAPPPAVAPSAVTLSPNATFTEQAAAGQELYGAHCASCHGPGGEGTKAPRVVDIAKGALPLDPPATAKFRKSQFHTAADIAGFVVKTMPADAPGSLTEDQYWAILAFDLKANGVDLGAKHLDATSAASVVVHP